VNFDLQVLERSLHQASLDHSANCSLPISLDKRPFPAFKVHVFETVSSTNTVIWELLRQGAEAGTVVIALRQQAGRGQRGHQWRSEPGGLYLSLGLTPNVSVDQAGQLTLGSAWGIAAALRHHGVPVGIKWLNDLVVNGYKLGGILTETRIAREQILSQALHPIDSLEILAAIVLHGLKWGYLYWQQAGSNSLITAYETLLVNRGQSITVNGEAGTIVGVTSAGQLRVLVDQSIPTELCLEPGSISLGYCAKAKGINP
jgi:BirA family transcriptional regulator, biotin operon repressor / biotin---[acetyl-CoA-carboxylase] ligase